MIYPVPLNRYVVPHKAAKAQRSLLRGFHESFSPGVLVSSCDKFCLVLGFLLFLTGCGGESANPNEQAVEKKLKLSIVRQIPLECDTSLPVALTDGFLLTDEKGVIRRFNHSFQILWSVEYKGMDFSAGAVVDGDSLFACSTDGMVAALKVEDGSTLWTNALDAAFLHSPLYGSIDNKDALWLLSSDSGMIYCLNPSNGELLWKSEETNRSDGGMVIWNQRLIYGNCDGAAHVFSAVDGKLIASVPVGDSDQMAGTPVVTWDGLLFIGTRQGNLAVIDLNRNELLCTMKISEEEAFAAPVLCEKSIAFGIEEGEILLFDLKDSKPFVKNRFTAESSVEYLLCDGDILYALAGGELLAFSDGLKPETSLNVGDSIDGISMQGTLSPVVKADRTLLFIEGIWK